MLDSLSSLLSSDQSLEIQRIVCRNHAPTHTSSIIMTAFRVPRSSSFHGLRCLFISLLLISLLDGVSLVIKNMVVVQDMEEIKMSLVDSEDNPEAAAAQSSGPDSSPERLSHLLDFLVTIRLIHQINFLLIIIELGLGVMAITSIKKFGCRILFLHFAFMIIFLIVMMIARITLESFDLRTPDHNQSNSATGGPGNIFVFLSPPTSFELMTYVKLLCVVVVFLLTQEVRRANKQLPSSNSSSSQIALA